MPNATDAEKVLDRLQETLESGEATSEDMVLAKALIADLKEADPEDPKAVRKAVRKAVKLADMEDEDEDDEDGEDDEDDEEEEEENRKVKKSFDLEDLEDDALGEEFGLLDPDELQKAIEADDPAMLDEYQVDVAPVLNTICKAFTGMAELFNRQEERLARLEETFTSVQKSLSERALPKEEPKDMKDVLVAAIQKSAGDELRQLREAFEGQRERVNAVEDVLNTQPYSPHPKVKKSLPVNAPPVSIWQATEILRKGLEHRTISEDDYTTACRTLQQTKDAGYVLNRFAKDEYKKLIEVE